MYTIVLLVATVGLPGLCLLPHPGSAQVAIEAAGPYRDIAGALTSFIEAERAEHKIPAISLALVDGDRVVWAVGFGWADSVSAVPATAATVYRVGSVSKLFTDIAVMQLVERGELELDAPVTRYLPDFHPRNPFGGQITIRELTAHRAGLTREPPVGHYFDDTQPSLAATVASLNRTSLVYRPGAKTKYSNAGIAVLGDVLERTQGESFYSYLQHAVLEPLGMRASAFQPLPGIRAQLAKGYMWTLDGRRFEAPTFQLGMGPAGSLYTSVLDLSRFLSALFAGGALPNGSRLLAKATLDSMWTPQYAERGATSGFGIGFGLGNLDGHRTVGHGGAIYGFATTLQALPDDSLGVVVVATLDVMNPVTDDIAEAALRMMLAARDGKPLPAIPSTSPLTKPRALALMGRYMKGNAGVDLEEYGGKLYMTPVLGGMRSELRLIDSAGAATAAKTMELAGDDQPGLGTRVHVLGKGRIAIGSDTLRRLPTPGSQAVPMAEPKPQAAGDLYAGLIGEYGWDHDVLYIREKDGKLNALIEWFFEYPLRRVSRDVYRFPNWGLYDGQEIVFHRGTDGRATRATAATVPFKRRSLPGDDDRVNFRITPVKPVADLRAAALAAQPPTETGDFRPSDLVELQSLDSSIVYDIRYATSNNFMGTPFYNSAHAFMQRPAAEAVALAARRLKPLGYGLLVHDAYRPWYVTKMFWDGTPVGKHLFVADPSDGSRHNRGCAVDITLYDLKTGQPVRMTGGYDELSDRSYPLYPGGTSLQRWHRDLLRHAMEAEGLTVYEAEWWHFDYKDWRKYRIQNLTFEQLASAQAGSNPGRAPPAEGGGSQNSPQPDR
jgi:CubicO group peptidase (beta-lactamase class C family)/D-alanyl-D-alanine dipeptidase